jgi:hypothetical protein
MLKKRACLCVCFIYLFEVSYLTTLSVSRFYSVESGLLRTVKTVRVNEIYDAHGIGDLTNRIYLVCTKLDEHRKPYILERTAVDEGFLYSL